MNISDLKKTYNYSMGAIHIHSKFSDGSGDIEQITKAAKKAGLDWIIITDHNLMEVKENFYNGVCVIVGEEISPKDSYHYLGLGINKVISPKIGVENYINEVVKSGGFGFAAHPDEADYRKNKAKSIKIAEASKIIENSQRDVNIAFMNELAKIFNAMGIDTNDVIEAASSKWNFIKLKPGLVGGHCISVDPYYLIQKAQVYGILPRVMMASRVLNDGMGEYVANQVIKLMNKKGILVKDSKILLLGFAFKEDCPDIRNTKVADIYLTLKEYTDNIVVYDPWVNQDSVKCEYGISLQLIDLNNMQPEFDAVVLAVAHQAFKNINLRSLLRIPNGVVYDVKGCVDIRYIDGRL